MNDTTAHALDALAPHEPFALAWDDVVRRVTLESPVARRRTLGWRGRRLSVALAAALLLFAAAAVAAVKEGPWWQTGAPPVDPQQVASVARDNMPAHVDIARARTVVTAGNAALVAVPLNATGYCLIPAIDGRATFGAQCQFQVTNPARGDDDRAISYTRRANGNDAAAWILYGRITDPRAARLDLGPLTLDLASGGFFLRLVPEADWSQLSGSATTGSILDATGHILRHGCVNWGMAPTGTSNDGEFAVPLWTESTGGNCTVQKPSVLPTVETNTARKVFDVTLTHDYGIWKAGQTITFEAAQRSDGAGCLISTGPDEPGNGFSGGCDATSDATSATRPIDVNIGAGLTHVGGKPVYAFDISGSVAAGSRIAKLELHSSSGVTPVQLGGGFFFAQLPATTPGPRTGTVPLPPGRWVLVGLDTAGDQIARVDLVELHRQATPH